MAFGVVYLALLGLGTVGALVVYLLLVAFVPVASGTRLDAMKTALLVVAGSGAGAGAGLYVHNRKQQTDETKSSVDHTNSRRDQDKLFTERYTQAAAQLGNTAATVRLAGVYALARIADDSGRDRPTCLKMLCAYLRMPYDPDDPAKADEREVRTTAQTVLIERLHADHPGFWAGAEIDLRGAHLIDFDLSRATVAVLRANRARFSGDAWFGEATFSGDAVFDEATFSENAWFGEATFSGDAVFDETTFSENAVYSKATFSGNAWFSKATFSENAWFDEATFSRYASFDEATFSGNAAFGKATFSGHAEFGGARFRRDRPPVWPDGFAEPAGIVWDPPDPPVSAPGPEPSADPAGPSPAREFPESAPA